MLLIICISILSSVSAQSIRKDYNEMTGDEKDAYVDALHQLHLGIVMTLANYHDQNFNDIHFNPPSTDVFLAWHRRANIEMEEAIQSIYPQLSIPYWNWVNDNSENDPLWDEDFLGQFDEEWDLDREFNNIFGGLPDQSDVNSAQSITNWDQYTDNLEGSIVHTGAHNWVGGFNGVMSGPNSPLDPVFYMHHGMIDKLWQDWEEANSASSYQQTELPRYPNDDPNDITDSRALNVWYAENGVVLLDQYETSGTNDYRYTGKIQAEDNFVVKNGSSVAFTAGNEIVLGPGFQVEAGGEFYAEVDPDVGNIAAKRRGDIADESFEDEDKPVAYSLSQNYPNPFNPATVISFELPAASDVTLEVFDILGRRVAVLLDGTVSAGRHEVQFDASNLSSGMYIYRIRANNFVQTRQMTLVK